jgi:hypothetical protein
MEAARKRGDLARGTQSGWNFCCGMPRRLDVQTTEIAFGSQGNCAKFVSVGWSGPETGFRWMTGDHSEVLIDQTFEDKNHILEIDLSPLTLQSVVPHQRLSILVNGALVAQETIVRPGRVGFIIPANALLRGRPVAMDFLHPDAASPEQLGQNDDRRLLSFLIRKISLTPVRSGPFGESVVGNGAADTEVISKITGLLPAAFMSQFESLGDNCEFGLVQRRCGAEPLGLLRFSNTELPQLLRGLNVQFSDFGDPKDLDFVLDNGERPEYVVKEKRYGLVYHTFRYKGEVDKDKLVAAEPHRLRFLVRKLIEDLSSANKIFVVKRNRSLTLHEILPLYRVLNSFGSNYLLWVVPIEGKVSSGSVESVLPGLFRGFIERFAPPENAHDLALGQWIEICLNAFEMSKQNGFVCGPDGAESSGGSEHQ